MDPNELLKNIRYFIENEMLTASAVDFEEFCFWVKDLDDWISGGFLPTSWERH